MVRHIPVGVLTGPRHATRASGQPTTFASCFLLFYGGTNWAKANVGFTRQMTKLLAVPGADATWGLGSSSLGNLVTDTNA